MRKIIPEEVEFSLVASADIPVRGSMIHLDDDELNREYEKKILERLESGDIWAWASVTVRVSWGGFEGNDHLGGCNYIDKKDFQQPGGYFEDMLRQAFDEMVESITAAGWDVEYVKEKIIAHGVRTA